MSAQLMILVKFFPSTYNSISILRHVSCLEDNNIADSHLTLTNLLYSYDTKSPSSLTSNLNFHQQSFLCLCLVFINTTLLHQPLQNVLINVLISILTNFTFFLIVCLKFKYKLCGTMTFYMRQHKNLLRFLFDSFLTCNVLKITCSIPMEDFSLNFKVFILITTCLVFCLKNRNICSYGVNILY